MLKKFLSIVLIMILCAIEAGAVMTLTVNSGSPVRIDRTRIGQANFKAVPVDLNCATNNGNPWELQVQATNDLTDATTGYSIPIELLKWYGAWKASATGAFTKGTGGESVPLMLSPDAVYTDTNGNNFPGVSVQVGLGVVIPDAQPQGNYSTTVQFIMTE